MEAVPNRALKKGEEGAGKFMKEYKSHFQKGEEMKRERRNVFHPLNFTLNL